MEKSSRGVGIVVVAHSRSLAEEVIKFASIMKSSDFALINGAGIDETSSEYGTNALLIQQSIIDADAGKGVLVFVDLGSSVMNAQVAIETLLTPVIVRLVDCPLIEGVVAAVAANHEHASLQEVVQAAEEARSYHKI